MPLNKFIISGDNFDSVAFNFDDNTMLKNTCYYPLTDSEKSKLPLRPYFIYLIEFYHIDDPSDIILHLAEFNINIYKHQAIAFAEFRSHILFQKSYFFVETSLLGHYFTSPITGQVTYILEIDAVFRKKYPHFKVVFYWKYQ